LPDSENILVQDCPGRYNRVAQRNWTIESGWVLAPDRPLSDVRAS
jgi:hypothetical protein